MLDVSAETPPTTSVPALSFTAIESVDLGDNCISATHCTLIARADMQPLIGQLQLFSSTNTVLSTCNITVNSEVAVTIASQTSPCIDSVSVGIFFFILSMSMSLYQ